MITADQLVCHGIGDYVLQSDWMAGDKTLSNTPATAHVLAYAVPFLFLDPSLPALAVIIVTHFLIDRYRLARYVVWLKNCLCPPNRRWPWFECKTTGYPPGTPPFLAVWLLIIADNILHVLCNGLALAYL